LFSTTHLFEKNGLSVLQRNTKGVIDIATLNGLDLDTLQGKRSVSNLMRHFFPSFLQILWHGFGRQDFSSSDSHDEDVVVVVKSLQNDRSEEEEEEKDKTLSENKPKECIPKSSTVVSI
jgi:hypothetical protein